MKYTIVVRLSRRFISFYYHSESLGRQGLFPAFEGSVRMPLAIHVSASKIEIGKGALQSFLGGSKGAYNDIFDTIRQSDSFDFRGERHALSELLLVALEYEFTEILSATLLNKVGTLEDNRRSMALGIIFDEDIREKERQTLLDQLQNKGYGNVAVLQLDHFRMHHVKNNPYVLFVSSNSEDVFCRLYQCTQQQLMDSCELIGAGKDPRVEEAARQIWADVTAEASYLDRETAWPVLRQIAEEFLQSGRSELEGTVQLAGQFLDFIISRKKIERTVIETNPSTRILTQLSEILQKNGIERERCAVVLLPDIAENVYFLDMLRGSFPEMVKMDRAFEEALLTEVGESIIANDYVLDATALNDLSRANFVGGLDALPRRNVKIRPGENAVEFNIDFPEGVSEVEIYRDKQLVRSVRTATFTDYGETDQPLKPEQTYQYTLVAVFINSETNARQQSRPLHIEVTTAAMSMPAPVEIAVENKDGSFLLTWSLPERGQVKVYQSMQPFGKHYNDRVSAAEFSGESALPTLDTTYRVDQNFCGECFFLPVTFVGDLGIVGKEVSVTSVVAPDGVRLSNEKGIITAHWLWNNVPAVRVRWCADGGNEEYEDIIKQGDTPSSYTLRLSKGAENIRVCVTSIVTTRKGIIESKKRDWLSVQQKSVVVDFKEFKDESGLFSRNKFSVTVVTDSVLPCDLHLVLMEGSPLFDRNNYMEHMTLLSSDLTPRQPKKFPFTYMRQNKKETLYARLVVADQELRNRVKIFPETQKCK
ncbi:MAG: hypothetical protein IJT75_00755 [Bacteroidaceae bacterium]|nr:hypothetical protein [Bacteroidaceae bacterium]